MGQRALIELWKLVPLFFLYACSGGESSTQASSSGDSVGTAFTGEYYDSPVLPGGLQELQQESALLTDLPTIATVRTMADSGLQIVYTEARQSTDALAESIQRQWHHMQQCLEVTAMPPTILVLEQWVSPFLPDDDVLMHFEVPVASATTRDYSVIQISMQDFNGSLRDSGYYLRSIIGRSLWLSANLAVRDYPYQCAASSTI